MKRHDFDIVSLVSGLLFGGLGTVFALHAVGAFGLDVRVVPAVVLIVLGLAGILAAATSSTRTHDSDPLGTDSEGAGADTEVSLPDHA
jgi:hypothetical protein